MSGEMMELELQVAELQAQLEAVAVTPQQQPDGDLMLVRLELQTMTQERDAIKDELARTVERLDNMTHSRNFEQQAANALRSSISVHLQNFTRCEAERSKLADEVGKLKAQISEAEMSQNFTVEHVCSQLTKQIDARRTLKTILEMARNGASQADIVKRHAGKKGFSAGNVSEQLRKVRETFPTFLAKNISLKAATPDGSRSWQCELTEAQNRLEAALESWQLTKEDLEATQAVRLQLEARLSSYHKHEQELRDILGWARSFQRCGLTIQPSRLVQLMQKITLHDGTAKLFFEETGS